MPPRVSAVDSDDGTIHVPLVPDTSGASSIPFRVRARSTVVKRFTWEGGVSSTNLAGVQLGIQVSCELPDLNFADNTATSPSITPLYAPR